MQALYDFLPVAAFFITLQVADIYKATAVLMVATVAVAARQWIVERKVSAVLLVSMGLGLVFGGLTLYFRNPMFIMWKPSIYFWGCGLTLWISQTFFHKNLFRSMLGEDITLPDTVWQRFNFAGVAFCAMLGLLNLVVVYFLRDFWVGFHTFGTTGLMFAFFVGMGLYLGKYMEPEPASDEPTQ